MPAAHAVLFLDPASDRWIQARLGTAEKIEAAQILVVNVSTGACHDVGTSSAPPRWKT